MDQIFRIAEKSGYITDNREYKTKGTYLAFLFFVYGFLVIIALVTLLNIINSVSMSVSAKMKQYGTMRAVGMSVRQVIRMIISESMTYALTGSLFGCVIGLIVNRHLYRILIEDHFGVAVWNIPFAAIIIITVFILGSVFIATAAASRHILKMSVTETINEL